MPFLTDTGVIKLKKLESDIKAIQEKKYEDKQHSSEYSKSMALNALQIIDYILKNNNNSVRSIDEVKKLVSHIENHISIIDNKKFTAVPAVFNEESKALATAFCKFLKELNLSLDAKPEINFVLQMKQLFSKAPASAILDQHIREVESAIRLYNLIATAKQDSQDVNTVLERIADLKAKKEADTISEYEKIVMVLLQDIMKLRSVSLQPGGIEAYVNQTMPYEVDLSDLVAVSLVSKLFIALLELEESFNKRLPQGSPNVSFALDYILTVYTKDRVEHHKQNVLKQLNNAELEIKSYLPGAHLRVFQSIPPEKKKLMQGILTQIQIAKENTFDDGVSRSAFTLYKDLARASAENLAFSQRKGISPGECGRILSKYQPIMLELAMERHVGSDEQYFRIFMQDKERMRRLAAPSFALK